MPIPLPPDLAAQLDATLTVLDAHLGPARIAAVHLFGSAIDGGLKPRSDIDLLVSVHEAPDEAARAALMHALLAVSAPAGEAASGRRPLEVTVLALPALHPWQYPARRELQFGEWLREALEAGHVEPPMADPDLAVLLTQARQKSLALRGPEALALLPAVPPADLRQALQDTVAQWNTPADWAGDERNVVLALARIHFTAATGGIAPKDVAAAWWLERLPAAHRVVLADARAAYLGLKPDDLGRRPDEVEAWIRHACAALRNAWATSR